MGMEYKHAGSASYGRFHEEQVKLLKDIGVKVEVIPEEELNKEKSFDSMYGLENRYTEKICYILPDDMPEIVKNWCSYPYTKRDDKELSTIFEYIDGKINCVRSIHNIISNEEYEKEHPYLQILLELTYDYLHDESWIIYG